MKNDELYNKLRERMYAVSSVPPQDIGLFTPFWRKIVPHIKESPIRFLMLGGFLSTLFTWVLLGSLIVRIVSLLQYGF